MVTPSLSAAFRIVAPPTTLGVTALTLPQAYAIISRRDHNRSDLLIATSSSHRSFTTSILNRRSDGKKKSAASKRSSDVQRSRVDHNGLFARQRFQDGYAGKIRDDNRSRNGNNSAFARDRSRERFSHNQQPPKADFSLPKPFTIEEVQDLLKDTLEGFAKDVYLVNRFEAIGLKGQALTDLLATTTAAKGVISGVSHSSRASILRQLMYHWSLTTWAQVSSATSIAESPLLTESVSALLGVSQSSGVGVARKDALMRLHTRDFLQFIRDGLVELATSEEDPTDLIRSARLIITALDNIRALTSLVRPHLLYPSARAMKRQIHLHIGPTNSGKTHAALVRLCRVGTGVYLGPLRLLAHEIWERINNGKIAPDIPPRACNLKTGEEEQIVEDPRLSAGSTGLTSCTVEMFEATKPIDVLVIDEIQMIADEQRGYAWTHALLAARALEIHLCGEPSVLPLIKEIARDCGDGLIVHDYERLTPLKVASESLYGDLDKVRPGDCMVAFSRSGIFALKAKIEAARVPPGQPRLKCAVAYGNLPPEVKAEQARLFNDGVEANVMVASDAIGMGLNLRIKRMIFETTHKWNGQEMQVLSASQIKQIAGRAGRFGTRRAEKDGEQEGGLVCTLQQEGMPVLRAALESPMRELRHASIQPTPAVVELLSTMLPPMAIALPRDHWKVREGTAEQRKPRSRPETVARMRQGSKPSPAPWPPWKLDEDGADVEAIQSSSHALPEGMVKAYTDIYSDMSLLCDVDPSRYVLSDFRQQEAIFPLVQEASRVRNQSDEKRMTHVGARSESALTLSERAQFCTAPINTRDPILLSCFKAMIARYAEGGIVDIESILKDEGVLDSLFDVETVIQSMHSRWVLDHPTRLPAAGTGEKASGPPASVSIIEMASYLPPESPFKATILVTLESLHRALSLYVWLSARNQMAFPYRGLSIHYRDRTEKAIEFTLQAMRAGRSKRLQRLGRVAKVCEGNQGTIGMRSDTAL